MENENKTSKEEYMKKHAEAIQVRYAHLKECQTQVDSVLQQLEGSDDPRIVEQILTMKNIQGDLAQKEVLLRNYAKQAYDDSEQTDNPLSTVPSDVMRSSREMNGVPPFCSEEESVNIQNHLLEKVKASQEKLLALREHQTYLISMQKKAEDKLAAFQAQIAENHTDSAVQNDQEWRFSPKLTQNSSASNKASVNGESHWEKDNFSDNQTQWPVQNSVKSGHNNQQKVLENGWSDGSQDLSRLHVNLDHIKRRLELLQQLSNQSSTELENNRSVLDISPMQEELPENIDLDRRAAIEWERKKLKNTLVELQEKQKVNESLRKQLLMLKDVASAVEYKDEESPFQAVNIQETQPPYSEENIRTLEDLRETINQLRRMVNNRALSSTSNDDSNLTPVNFTNSGSQQDVSSNLQPHLPTSAKRDNIRKEEHNQFPARRHYEAEGRANEDADVPVAPVAAVATPVPDPNAWENDMKIQEKKRQLENTKQKLQMMQNLVNSIQDARASGQLIPVEFLQALSSFNEDDEEVEEEDDEDADEIDFDDDNTVTDNEDSQDNGDSSVVIVKNKPSEMKPAITRVKECANDVLAFTARYSDNDRELVERGITDEVQNLEQLKSERERLVKLQEKFLLLQQKYSAASKQNNEATRCSGEGGNLQEKKSRQVAPASPVPQAPARRPRQENLLTRQNVATVESQTRNNSNTIPKPSAVALKKDNINDLSAKLIKPSGHGPTRTSSDTLNKYTADAPSPFSTHLNQSLSLREVQHKSVLEDILKHDKNKPQNYVRRDNHIHSSSSVNSEPLDGSGRSFAPDTTVAATWGGSSTQENFEDENEPESLEEQEEEEEEGSNNEIAGNISESIPRLACESNRYRNEQPYANYSIDSSSKRRDNRLHKYFKSTQLNQWSSRKNFSQPETSCNRNRNLPIPPSAYSSLEPPQECSQPSGSSIGSTNPLPMPTKFVHQLQQQLDKLNALCRPVLHDPYPSSTESPSATAPLQPLSNGDSNAQGRSSQTVNDIMQHYTQQLQLQQQLLLSLSQCYHALYIQQLEIQHLNRCLQQNPESDTGVQHLSNVPAAPSEDFVFRPWFLSPWLNSSIPQMPFAAGQVSPMSAPPFLQPSQPAFTFNPTIGTANPSPAAPCALVTGVQPARAVVHPDRQNSETLNNQVPPRSRANNFWDNFRSQTRQNLLSSSNTARAKDSSGHSSSPQVRQVHPVVPNESSWAHRSRVFIPPHTESTPPVTHTPERAFTRPATDSSFRIACRAKKPNWSRQPTNPVIPDSTVGSGRYNLCPEIAQTHPSNIVTPNAEHQTREVPSLANSRTESCFQHARPKSSACASNIASERTFESVQAEVAKILSQNDDQSSYLMELLRELRNLSSESLPRALTAVRSLASMESTTNAVSFSPESFENSSQTNQIATREKPDSSVENVQDGNFSSPFPSFHDPLPTKGSNESPCQRSNQNWPPATIIPLGKHALKPSTGAVKKRPIRESAPPIACAWIQASGPVQENEVNLPKTEALGNIVDKTIQDVLPFIQSHAADYCCPTFRTRFCSKVIDALKNNPELKISPEFILHLHPVLLHMLNRFSNLKLIDCEGELVKHLCSTLICELDASQSIYFRPSLDEGCDSTNSVPKKSAQPDLLPSSSKSFCEHNKQVLPMKEERETVESGTLFTNSGLQEYENHIEELFINMPAEDNLLPTHLNGNAVHEGIRGVVSAGCSPPTCNWPSQGNNAEEDMGYECEAEAEPEVEAGTEADLAEADQSPGQGSTAGGPTSGDSWHAVSQASCAPRTAIFSSPPDEIMITENGGFVEAPGVLSLSSQVTNNNSAEKEICLDDIPTKLSPLSQDELQKQMSEEQDSNSLLLEVVEDVPLARNGECPKDPPPYL